MTIASEITRINNNIASAYTAINNKGGTLPETQNSANLATAIESIPSGGSGYTELPNYQVENGVASKRSGALTGNEFSNITSVGFSGMLYSFYNRSELKGHLDLSSLTTVGSSGMQSIFNGCYNITSLDLSSLTSVGDAGLYYAFDNCSGLTSVDLSSLTSVGSYGVAYSFNRCSKLTDIYFNSLTTTSFGSYTTQFRGILTNTGTSVTHTLHFPSNLESTISGLDDYPNFGGTSGYVVCAFDLPATS